MASASGGILNKKGKKSDRPKPRTIRMMVIPEPASNTRFVLRSANPELVAIRGQGNVRMICGNCGHPLAEKVKVVQLQSVVLYCHNCGAYNETLA